jgi:hypothetical protein
LLGWGANYVSLRTNGCNQVNFNFSGTNITNAATGRNVVFTIVNEPAPTSTPIPTNTATPSPTITPTFTNTPFPTNTVVPTETNTVVPTFTETPIPTETEKVTPTPTFIATSPTSAAVICCRFHIS